jgi:putative RecB family exonuclease
MSTLSELRKKPHWSFSSLNGLINICSLQWFFRYIEKREAESTPVALLFGSAFHKAAEWIARWRMDNEYAGSDEAMDVFSEAWLWECRAAEKLSMSKEEFETLNATGRRMIRCLNREWVEANVIAVSKVFSVELPGASKPLIGEIDCIVCEDDGRHTLIDWKTAARKWPAGKADKDLQATCFMFAYEQSAIGYKAEDNRFRYDVVTKAKEPSYIQNCTTRSADDFLRLSQFVSTAEKLIQAEAFLPSEQGYFCGGCQYASACKEWHRAQAKQISLPTAEVAA